MNLTDFKLLGGEPSGKFGSNYSSICKLVQKVDDLDISQSYLEKKQRDARRNLYEALARFHPNDDGAAEKKTKEIAAARKLKTEMDNESQMDRVKVSELLDKMANDPMPLIRNTGKGLTDLFSKGNGLAMGFKQGGAENAIWAARTITIYTANFWQSENLATGVLVHEYHHYLTKRMGEYYADEFVAHWKQYLAMRANRTAKDLNKWLLDDPLGYKLRQQKDKFKGVEFKRPEDAGPLWTKNMDNRP